MLDLLAQTTITTTEVTMTEGEVAGMAAFMTTLLLFGFAILLINIIAMWRLFDKAGEAGWKSIIPLYDLYLLCRIAGRNGWWMLSFFVPGVNIVTTLIVMIDLAKHFGKSTTFGIVGLWLFQFIGLLILGFGDAKYVGPKHA